MVKLFCEMRRNNRHLWMCGRSRRKAEFSRIHGTQLKAQLLFQTPRFPPRIFEIFVVIIITSITLVDSSDAPRTHTQDVMELNPVLLSPSVGFCSRCLTHLLQILTSASVSRISCALAPRSQNFACIPEELPSSRYYKVGIFNYVDFSGAGPGTRAVNFTCSMHLDQCHRRASHGACDDFDAKEYPCRVNAAFTDSEADASQLLHQLVGFVHPLDAPHPISKATKFVFKVYASRGDDDAVLYERSLPPLGPWIEYEGAWVIDPSDDDAAEPEAAHDSASGGGGGGGGG
jgi:hypothetical protein